MQPGVGNPATARDTYTLADMSAAALEKNVDAFLHMPWHGSKLLVGDGPERLRLQAQYPSAVFAGFKYGDDLAAHLAAADILVFPSRTDTFGLVNLEAMACGVPVAAYPVQGPRDVIRDGVTEALDEDLARAAARALLLNPADCRQYALPSGWDASTREFEANLVPAGLQQRVLVKATRPLLHGTSGGE